MAHGWRRGAEREVHSGCALPPLFTTLRRSTSPSHGELRGAYIFIHEPIIAALEAQNEAKGIMDGRQLAVSFSLLRENSLYWNYYIDSYLRARARWPSICCTGTATAPNVAGKTHAVCCAASTWRTSW